jgi:rhodanese-related sulfurtransferase
MLGSLPAVLEFSLIGRPMTPSSTQNYAGDISPRQAWEMLTADPKAQLVDVRTFAEWNFVGLPDLSSLSRQAHCVEWQTFPTMEVNPAFASAAVKAVTAAGAGQETPLLMLCRSGARSRAAAVALAGAGFAKAYNIAGGFEGDPDGMRHRGHVNGWKAEGLPWRQS